MPKISSQVKSAKPIERRSISSSEELPEISLKHKEILLNNSSMDVETQMVDTMRQSEAEEEKTSHKLNLQTGFSRGGMQMAFSSESSPKKRQ